MVNLNEKYTEQIITLVSDLSFESQTSLWSWKGDNLGIDLKEAVKMLSLKFYYVYFTDDDTTPEYNGIEKQEKGSIERFTPFLQRFNESRFWFKVNETNIKLTQNQLLVEKDSQKIVINHGEYIDAGAFNDSNEQQKQYVYLNKPKKSLTNSDSNPNQVAVEGDQTLFINDKPIIRFYFNLRPIKDGILAWADFLAKRLDSFGIPYRFKYNENLESYTRRDVGVLYVAQNHFNLVAPIIKEIYGVFKENGQYDIIRNQIPFFTKEIYPGIGMAEDLYDMISVEGKVLSFGKYRCLTIAQELVNNDEAVEALKAKRFDEVVNKIIESLKVKGFNIDEFYRTPFTNYKYNWDLLKPDNDNKRPYATRTVSLPQWSIKGREHFLKIAQKYANELCERAIWLDSDTCTWITYDEKKKDNSEVIERFHRLLNVDEKRKIRYFLYKISDFVEEKEYYNRVAKSTYPTEIEKQEEEELAESLNVLQKILDASNNKSLNLKTLWDKEKDLSLKLKENYNFKEFLSKHLQNNKAFVTEKPKFSLKASLLKLRNFIFVDDKNNQKTFDVKEFITRLKGISAVEKAKITMLISDFKGKYLTDSDKEDFNKSGLIFDLLLREVSDLDLKLMDKQISANNRVVNFNNLTEDQAILLAETFIKKFENVGLPLRNSFKNYNYCPNFNGRLYVAFFFLVLYKPVAFPKFKFAMRKATPTK